MRVFVLVALDVPSGTTPPRKERNYFYVVRMERLCDRSRLKRFVLVELFERVLLGR